MFQQNLRKYEQHKSGKYLDLTELSPGVIQLCGLSDQEFEDRHMGGYKMMPGFSPNTVPADPPSYSREEGAIYPVQDQQAWAYATTAQIESYNKIQEPGGRIHPHPLSPAGMSSRLTTKSPYI